MTRRIIYFLGMLIVLPVITAYAIILLFRGHGFNLKTIMRAAFVIAVMLLFWFIHFLIFSSW